MKYTLAIVFVVVTAILLVIGYTTTPLSTTTGGAATGFSLPAFVNNPTTAEQALGNFLVDVQKHNWGRAFSEVETTSDAVNEQSFIQSWQGSGGGLRSNSNLEGYDSRPMHVTDNDAQMRVRMHYASPVGRIEDVRDFHLVKHADQWKIIWDETPVPNVPAQVIPVNYLRWDLVSGNGGEEWGSHNVDAPHVRIVSMNAVETGEGVVVMGEAVNEDTIPAFVNVNSTLVDGAGNTIDDESSFDKVLHVLLPKQVSPYRVDFPHVSLNKVKNVRMDVKATLVPASADPVIGLMNQKMDTDPQGRSVLRGEVSNQSGQVVNIPHVIASFYDNNGKVVWVADGYVERALLPQSTQPFSVEIPKSLAGKVQSFHVVVNQYSIGKS